MNNWFWFFVQNHLKWLRVKLNGKTHIPDKDDLDIIMAASLSLSLTLFNTHTLNLPLFNTISFSLSVSIFSSSHLSLYNICILSFFLSLSLNCREWQSSTEEDERVCPIWLLQSLWYVDSRVACTIIFPISPSKDQFHQPFAALFSTGGHYFATFSLTNKTAPHPALPVNITTECVVDLDLRGKMIIFMLILTTS